MEDNDPRLLDEAIRICHEVAQQIRANNTYYRNKTAHVTHVASYGADMAELCAERIERLKAIRNGEYKPQPPMPSNAGGNPPQPRRSCGSEEDRTLRSG